MRKKLYNYVTNIFYLFICMCVFQKIYAENISRKLNRVGISLGGTGLHSGFVDYDNLGYTTINFGVLLDYDRMGILPWRHWSLGGEVGLFGYNVTLEPRMLWRENQDMSGFYAGPKLYLSMGRSEAAHSTNVHLGAGAEGGWLYHFPQNFDLGIGADLIAMEHGLWSDLKITAGYLF